MSVSRAPDPPLAAGLSVTGLTQRFGDRLVLDSVSLAALPGRVTGLLGPNGAGKTTLMRILFGVLRPDAGSVRWHGHDVNAEHRRSWGYMPQERGLYTEMKAHDHLVWIARLHGVDKATAAGNAERLLTELGLADRANDRIKDLSGGMAQRVQLAAAMVHEPELLVLDEPFAGLDPTAVQFLSDVITGHVARGRTLLFSSHQLDLVEELCESIVMINRGRVVLDGELTELRSRSDDRYLAVDAALTPTDIDPTHGVVVSSAPGSSRIRLAPGADAAAVLDAVRARHTVRTFAVEQPRLSEMFLSALEGDS